MKFFFDTEFYVKDGLPVNLMPISIGLAAEDGRDYYAEFMGAREAASATKWLQENVLFHLKGEEIQFAEIARQISEFVGSERPEFMAAYGSYDWVVLCQCFGGLMMIPEHWPCFYTETVPLALPSVERVGGEHNSINDAGTLRKSFLSLTGKIEKQ